VRIVASLGTRPEAIKIAPVVLAARQTPGLETLLLSTGQHKTVQQDVLDLFGLRPDLRADVMKLGQSLSELSARCLRSLAPILAEAEPDVLIVQGDTTSAAMAALSGFYAGIPVCHVEAGLRTSTPNLPFPEEMNRRLIGRLASFHFAPTAVARDNLLREGVDDHAILVTDNTGIDALLAVRDQQLPIRNSKLARFLDGDGPVLVVTIHRRENWGRGVREVAAAVRELVTRLPELRAVYAAHPNPAVRADVESELGGHERALVADPLGYGDFVRLLAGASVIVTDSGGIQEEAPSLGVPVLVARDETERVEGLRAGLTTLVGTDRALIVRKAAALLRGADGTSRGEAKENPYGDGRASERIVSVLRSWVGADGSVSIAPALRRAAAGIEPPALVKGLR
jgi:UDP-N-acetylglucosamine 2-epimerase (non-hydrolysing)